MLAKEKVFMQKNLTRRFPPDEKWESLLLHSAHPAPFLIPAWQESCLQFLPSSKKLEVFQHERHGRLCGLACLMDEPYLHVRRVRFLGTGSLDYLGFAYTKESEAEFFNAFFSAWKHRRNVILDFQQMNESFPAQTIADEAARQGFFTHVFPQDACPVLTLPENGDAYLKLLSQNQRKAIKRLQNKLHKNFSFSFRRAEAKEELDFVLPYFFKLHTQRWLKRGLPGMMYSKKIRDFHRMASHKLLEKGLLRFYWLTLNNEVAATLYGFHWNKIFYFYLSGFDSKYFSYGVGTLLFYEAITKSIEEGFTHFDFMRGREEYKYRLGAKDTTTYRMILSRNEKLFKAYTSFHKQWHHGAEAVKTYIQARGKKNGKRS